MRNSVIIGYDSARPEMIPSNAAAVFPYSDGPHAWSHKRFPHAMYRYITIHGDPNADIADYESGAIFGEGPLIDWARERINRHGPSEDVTVYTDRSNFLAVKDAMLNAKIAWHLFLSVGTDPVLESYLGMHVRACQRFGTGKDTDYVFDEAWLNRP